MKIIKNYNLSGLNTFGIKAQAKLFVEVKSEADLMELFRSSEFKENKKFFLGGGSNILFTKDFDGIVVLNKLKGMEVLENSAETVLVRSMGGEMWHDLVVFTVDRGYWGIENLSLIPGTVGASPVQNIGAYGVELKDILESVEAFDIENGTKRIFYKNECRFGYRESIFKNELKGQYFISAITILLSKKEKKNINYKALTEYLKNNNIQVQNSKDVSDIVSAIRRSKLPDPKIVGNVGSFFKNIFVTKEKLEELLRNFPGIPSFIENEAIKIPAGWLIEQCGWKGYRKGNVGVHDKQALVLVNYGGATGAEIMELADAIIVSVREKFGLDLVPEVNLI